MTESKKYFFIASLAKGLHVLELLADAGPLSVSRVAAHLGYNRAGAHRFLSTLLELGYVQKNQEGLYELSFKILELSTKLAARFEIRKSAMGFMRELSAAYKETINLGFLDSGDIIHLDKIDSPELLRIDPEIGSRAPAQRTALGKAILAYLPASKLDAFFQHIQDKGETFDISTWKQALFQDLEQIRKQGFATDDEELCPGLRCVAVPIFDHNDYPRYAISISGPTMRMPASRVQSMQRDLIRIGQQLSQRLSQAVF